VEGKSGLKPGWAQAQAQAQALGGKACYAFSTPLLPTIFPQDSG